MTNEITYFSSLTDKEPKLMSWETVTTVIRSNQLQQVCCEYQSTLTEYEKVGNGNTSFLHAVKYH